MKILRGVIVAGCLAVILFGCWKLYSIQSGYQEGEDTYAELEAYIIQPTAPSHKETLPTTDHGQDESLDKSAPETTEPGETEPEETEPREIVDFPEVDFESLRDINPKLVGWICCEGTPINYPFAQGPDDDYYLDHMFNGQPNGSGAIFMSSRNAPDFSDANSIVYGHNMKSGKMFAALSNFKAQKYYEEHPRFLVMTPEANYVMDVFAGVVMGEWDDVWKISFADEDEMAQWLDNIIQKSLIQTDIHPTPKDHILTLSTCSYEYNGARFTVLGVLREA